MIALAVYLAFRALSPAFPSDRTPEGAYVRIAKAVADGDPKAIFAYLETDAQWACFTIRDARKKALDRVRASYPPEERGVYERTYSLLADAPDGSDAFAILATQRGWIARLRKDLSGVARVEVDGPRASVVTARGTRYPFRIRENGIWGLTIFTADLVAESERASRDLAVVAAAAEDYERVKGASRDPSDSGALDATASAPSDAQVPDAALETPRAVGKRRGASCGGRGECAAGLACCETGFKGHCGGAVMPDLEREPCVFPSSCVPPPCEPLTLPP